MFGSRRIIQPPKALVEIFAATGTGWVRLSWPASTGDDWGTALMGLVNSLTDPLVREVGNQAATPRPAETAVFRGEN